MIEEIKEISVDLIDEPQDQQRIGWDEEKLQDLAQSIRAHGLLNPIHVSPKGARFELIAGWRRLKAHRLANLAAIKAIVLPVQALEADLLRAHENAFREDVNPIEDAIYISRLQEKHGKSAEEIAELMNYSVSKVRGRLELLTYPEYLLEPIARGQISLGAAGWLNKIGDEKIRERYVGFAVRGGITTSQAHAWFQSWDLGVVGQNPDVPPSSSDGTPVAYPALMAECIICRTKEELGNLGMFYLHPDCERAIRPMTPTKETENAPL